ncbi:MAG: hypothetical protein BWY80_00731 [Firmicutes bacterium ADurb.Bin456]|nr:MAG: hypothetical protein BWY80_00731 [Firmicutes bacterium ADurb.Bin456]
MYILDVGAQVLDSFFGFLPGKPVGMVHVPQSRHRIACHFVKEPAQAGSVGIDTIGFHQQGHTLSFGNRRQAPQGSQDNPVIHLVDGMGLQVRQDTDVWRAQPGGQVDVLDNFSMILLRVFSKLQAAAGRQARYFQTQPGKLFNCLRELFLRKRLRPDRGYLLAQPADFNSLKTKVLGHGVDFDPTKVRTTKGRKCKFHNLK